MVKKYKKLFDDISNVVDIANAENNQTGVVLSRNKINELVVNYLKYLTGVKNSKDLVVQNEIPTLNVGKFVIARATEYCISGMVNNI